MPELPDVTLYVEALAERLIGHHLVSWAIRSAFVLRTVDLSLDALRGDKVKSALAWLGLQRCRSFRAMCAHHSAGAKSD